MRNAGTNPKVVLSAGERLRCRSAAVRPTRSLRLWWLTGEGLAPDVLSRAGFAASGMAQEAGFAR